MAGQADTLPSEQLVKLREEIEERGISELIRLCMQKYSLSIGQFASLSQIDEDYLQNLLGGGILSLKGKSIAALLDSLKERGKISADEEHIWNAGLRIAAFLHYDYQKFADYVYNYISDSETKARQIQLARERQLSSLINLYDVPPDRLPKPIGRLNDLSGPFYDKKGLCYYQFILNTILSYFKLQGFEDCAGSAGSVANNFGSESTIFMFLYKETRHVSLLHKFKQEDNPVVVYRIINPRSIPQSEKMNADLELTARAWSFNERNRPGVGERFFALLDSFVNVPMISMQQKEFAEIAGRLIVPVVHVDVL